ncbi:MAG: transglutaminase-like domain-containing protein [Bacillota bacterium]|nr:transglutaminase-like domain-containing protein [Bacillota bacterium]
MAAEQFDIDRKIRLTIIFVMSAAMATALIQGLGYIVPGFFARSLYVLLFLALYTVIHYFPLVSIIFPLLLTAVVTIFFWNTPLLIAKITPLFIMPQPSDSLFWPLATILAITLFHYLVVFKFKNTLILLIAGLFAFIPLWYLYVDSAYPSAIFYTTSWLMLISYERGAGIWVRAVKSKKEVKDLSEMRQSWLTYTSIILSVAIFTTLILPKEIAPLPFPRLHIWVNQNLTFLKNLRTTDDPDIRGDGGDFDLFTFGFEEGAILGGPLYQDDKVMLEVTGKGGFYLQGTFRDYYTGQNWINSSEFIEGSDFNKPKEIMDNYLSETELTIRHIRLRTRTVFSIPFPAEISQLPGIMLKDRHGGIVMSQSIPLYYEYSVNGHYLAYRTNFSLLEEESGIPETIHNYLRLPVSLPERVHKLAYELTADTDGYYAKIKAIETYLRNNYTYTTELPSLPENRDFVDFFLFDLKEGYCTAFASALAIMGRAAGIPTRYVVGFIIPESPSTGGKYRIAGSNAHAWVEGYIPGIGWLPFEATPGFRTTDDLPLARNQPYHDFSIAPDGDFRIATARSRELLDFEDNYYPEFSTIDNSVDSISFLKGLVRVLIAATVITLLIIGIFIYRRYKYVKKKIRNMKSKEPRQKIVAFYNLSLQLLDRIVLGKIAGETPLEYSRRIKRDVHSWTLNFATISEEVSVALYSKDEVSEDLAHQAEMFFFHIFDRYLAQVGKVTAFIEILIQGRYFTSY